MPTYIPDTIALGIIAEGRSSRTGQGQLDHPVISEKGIKIAIATGLVESNLTMYANNGDPESLNFPHDAISRDANSSGVFQQRDPWWGTTADRMDVRRSAAMFYNSLARQRIGPNDYNTDATSPGLWAQMVQRSDYPHRYDERFGEAEAIFNRLATTTPPPANTPTPIVPNRPDFVEREMFGNGASSRSRPPTNFFIHTEEGNSSAEQLAHFCDGSNNVSYHYTLRDRIVYDVVDTDLYSWSVLDANVFSINLCFAGSRAAFTRQEWLAREGDISIAAYLAVQDCRKYNFSTEVIAPPYHQAPGISDHKYVTQCLHIGTHTDVGNNFPWEVFAHYVGIYSGSTEGIEDMASVPQDQWDRVYREVTQRYPSRSIYRSPGEGVVDTLTGMALNTDAMVHQELVERLAVEYGDEDSIKRIVTVASGRGADPNDQWAKDHALAAVKKIPAVVLKAWSDKQGVQG